METIKEKRKWLWPLARAMGLLPVSFKECKCSPPYTAADGSTVLTDLDFPAKECQCAIATRSLPWLVYSGALVSVLVPCTLLALHSDQERERKGKPTMRMTTTTDQLVTITDILSVSASSIICILQAALSQGSLFVLLAELQKVDRLLSIRPPGVSRRLALWVVFLVLQMLLDLGMWVELSQDLSYALSYLPFYGLYLNCFIMEALFIDDASSIHLRFKALNDKLMASLSYHELGPPEVVWGWSTGLEQGHSISSVYKSSTANRPPRAPQPPLSLHRLTAAHHLLCDSTLSVARRYGASLLGDMLSLLLHLVITAYFFFPHLLFQPSANATSAASQMLTGQYMTVQGCWLLLHLSRLIMIVLPCSRASAEAARTGALVSFMLNKTSPSTLTHKQLETLSIQLLHHKVSFNACGLFELGLPLVMSILGAVTTYLVVLLQLKSTPSEQAGNSTVTTPPPHH